MRIQLKNQFINTWKRKLNNLAQEYENSNLKISGNGTGDFEEEFITKEIPFEKYIVKVKLTLSGKFIGIEEISFSKDFLTNKQKLLKQSAKDVEEYYLDKEDE